MAKMTQDVPAFKQHIIDNADKLDWVLDFLEDNIHTKKGFVTIMDNDMKTKIPLYLKKSFEIVYFIVQENNLTIFMNSLVKYYHLMISQELKQSR